MSISLEPHIVEGTWEEISNHASEFQGRRLRLIVFPEDESSPINERLSALTAWLALPRPLEITLIDDSRSGIYGEEEDRG